MRILVAEDEPDALLLLEVELTALGHDVEAVESGRAALALYAEGRHPVVVTDWMMPDVDGLELCREIRAQPSTQYTYVILLTAKEGRDNYLRAIAAGVDDFLTKPLDRDLLAARLVVAQRIVRLRQHVRRLESLLPVCAWCKRIRDGDTWITLEQYLERHVGADISHGICPTCASRYEHGDWQEFGPTEG